MKGDVKAKPKRVTAKIIIKAMLPSLFPTAFLERKLRMKEHCSCIS